ncbi:PilZ domain-containing protein [Roseobacter sp. CCS2]|uniref:PilZ domain-containing protein n=1 Tax=Roseobacter sp. CCS2 TaxID=391593 RepID=UPI0000F402EC|nr:PilZ domain-containing protein [Roseobacter sp. CCS2]EBA12882.1 hypothetical protein RCCS2_03334 [Roseobacter sp. CCS2]
MQYRSHRYQTEFPIQLTTPTGRQQCHVTDVNSTGARLVGPQTLQRGDKVRFKVLNYDVMGVVCWSFGDKAGITFRPHLSSMQVDMLRYRRDAAPNRPRGAVGFAFAEL